jgi:hypothetical protein
LRETAICPSAQGICWGRVLRGALAVLLLLPGCGRIGFDLPAEPADGPGDGTPPAPIDAPMVWGPPFQAPAVLTEASSAGDEYYPDLAADGLSLYVASDGFPSPLGSADIYVLTRSDASQAFGAPSNTAVSTSDWDTGPSISADGLTLFYAPYLNDGFTRDIWMATRVAPDQPFANAERIAPLSAPGEDRDPDISRDGLTLYFDSDRAGSIGGTDIWMSTRADLASPFGPPVRIAELSSPQTDRDPNVSADELVMYLASDRPGGPGNQDLWVARRPDRASPWDAPQLLTDLSTTASEGSPSVADDGTIVWDATVLGTYDTWISRPLGP